MMNRDSQRSESTSIDSVPKHVAIIMDGNGRWAQQKGKLRTFGHKAGVDAVRESVKFARKKGITALTLFAFSSENWKRPEEEVGVLMDLFNLVLSSEIKRLNKNGVRLKVIGDTSRFAPKLRDKIQKAETLTANNSDLVLNIAANYGGRWDIVNACKNVVENVVNKTIQQDDITEELLSQYISTADLPELDLLIRTGGDHRISNFLLWQCAYAELYFTPTLWPDFKEDVFAQAVECFANRQRRFGLTGEQITHNAQGD